MNFSISVKLDLPIVNLIQIIVYKYAKEEKYSCNTLKVAIDYKVTFGNEYLLSSVLSRTMTATATLSHATTEPDLSKRSNNYHYFALCNSCFWCASYLRYMGSLRCPGCKTNIIEFMPIRLDETFLFQYDRKRGVSLQFLTA
jgi:hypothetical protein